MSIKTITLDVDGMSCGHCVASVENSLKELDGIFAAKVTLDENRVVVEYNPDKVNIMQMVIATTNAGYSSMAIQ